MILQMGPFSVPIEPLITGIWFGLSILFFALGHRLWKYRIASSLLVSLGGLTVVLFIYSAGLLVPTGGSQATPPSAIQTSDPKLFVAMIAVVITLFTGVALKITFDLRNEVSNALESAKSERQEERHKYEAAKEEFQWDTSRLRQQLDMVTKANELATPWGREGDVRHHQEFMVYRYLIRLFTDPRRVSGYRDLSLDLLRDRRKMCAVLTDENWEYICWLATSFQSNLPSVQREVRSSAEELYVSYRQEIGARPS